MIELLVPVAMNTIPKTKPSRPRWVAALAGMILSVLLPAKSAWADAHPVPDGSTTSEHQNESSGSGEETEPSRVYLGARGFGGVLFEEESAPAFGGALLAGVPIHGPFEFEPSVALAKAGEEPPFFIIEGIVKYVFERESRLSPHLALGPLLSVDIGEASKLSVGAIAGGGAMLWATPRFGFTLDLNYRLLASRSVEQAVTLALGVAVRPF